MHCLSIFIIVLVEAFHAPPVLLYAYQSRLNFAMLGVAMLKDVSTPQTQNLLDSEFCLWGVFKNFCQIFGQLCIKLVRVAL